MNRPASGPDVHLYGEALTRGEASGAVVFLEEPLSFWGGYDSERGVIVDKTHLSHGASLAGAILLMPRAKGSSSSSSVLAETIRRGTGPAGIVLRERDLIIAIGAIVAGDLYGMHVPVVVLGDADFATVSRSAQRVRIEAPDDAGRARVTVLSDPDSVEIPTDLLT
jgi:predicted aconitase with swiveling domain